MDAESKHLLCDDVMTMKSEELESRLLWLDEVCERDSCGAEDWSDEDAGGCVGRIGCLLRETTFNSPLAPLSASPKDKTMMMMDWMVNTRALTQQARQLGYVTRCNRIALYDLLEVFFGTIANDECVDWQRISGCARQSREQ